MEGTKSFTELGGRVMQHLIWATDFSERAIFALEWGRALAHEVGASLTLLHIAEENLPLDDFALAERRHWLEEHAQGLRQEGIKATVQIRQGHVPDSIAAFAGETKADLLLMGAQGQTGWKEKLLGSVTERVLQISPVPVLFVREKKKPRFHGVLVPTDFSTASLFALDFACHLAKLTDGKIFLLHVVRWLESEWESEEQLREQIRGELTLWSRRGVTNPPSVEPYVLRLHHAGAGITDFARHHGIDLIVMPTHTRNPLERLLIGSVASHVISFAPCPVITAKAEAFQRVMERALRR